MKKILIIGATSAIAEAVARLWAAEGHCLYLIGRNTERLAVISSDLLVQGAESVRFASADLNEFERHGAILDTAIAYLGTLDIVLIAHGSLGNQKRSESDFAVTLHELNTNAISVISLLTHLGNYLESQRYGAVAVISSVAGDRGRQSNYVYGTAKGALNIFLQGLRNRLQRTGIHVLTIKPGFVDTPMTAALVKGPLWVTPEVVARYIYTAIKNRCDVIYAPWFWFAIMTGIKFIPEALFKKLKL